MSSIKSTKSSFPTNLNLMAINLAKVLPSGVTSLVLDNESQTVAEIQSELQAASALYAEDATATELAKEAKAKVKAGAPAARKIYLQVAAYLRLMLGPTSSSLAEAGVTTQQPAAKPSVQTKAVADAQRRSTIAAGGVKAVRAKTAAQLKVIGAGGQEVGSTPVAAPTVTPVVGTKS